MKVQIWPKGLSAYANINSWIDIEIFDLSDFKQAFKSWKRGSFEETAPASWHLQSNLVGNM